jgi:two-component system chemotaxis response regulator CheY
LKILVLDGESVSKDKLLKSLVVDDEYVSRNKLAKIMETLGSCDAVESGREAVEAMGEAWRKGEPYDLVLLDIGMPDMDGTAVLYEIRRIETEKGISNEKRSKVLMVTSKSDKDTIVTSVQAGCDGFIVKPINRDLIISKLKSVGLGLSNGTDDKEEKKTIRESVLGVIKRFQKGDIELPVLPGIVQEVQQIGSRPDSTVDELSRAIEKDAVVSARLIATANSTVYRGLMEVRSVSQAVGRLGFRETQKIVLAIASKGLYSTTNKGLRSLMERLRLHSMACAYCATSIAGKLNIEDTGKFFLLGLIHDIGNVLLLWTLGEILPRDQKLDINEILESVREVHAAFSAALLQRWKFPEDFVNVVKMYEGPQFDSSAAREILIVNLACNLAFHLGYGFMDRDEVEMEELDSAKLLKIDGKAIEGIRDEVTEMIGNAGHAL